MTTKPDIVTVMNSIGIRALRLDSWETPATAYPASTVGTARIAKSKYRRGVYIMEGVDGYAVYYIRKPIPITHLFIEGKEWMLDDPLHWIGMQRLAEACHGRVLIVGLGLGLLVHAIAKNPRVTFVRILERNPDVVKLVAPLLPPWPRGEVPIETRIADFWDDSPDYSGFDVAIADIWTSTVHLGIRTQVLQAIRHLSQNGFHGETFVWGLRNSDLNPAVKPMSRNAEDFVAGLARTMHLRDPNLEESRP